ncbi:TM2 domain-containing protein [Sphingomonas sp.]|jgi:TM2 domain-containing membrane protein YozV|uniref:TM2 domain-containing protein n=1 Tax=Sphingomonas sp. TaxID=28214 RepID=UPI002E35C585|nr:TM2 domain-containing protein [Sphingomonas sp.]HEX4695951.1 TM2 domain-containing protein [Sphingomonas sp.]
MRGQVLGVDVTTGDGQISGDDGQRYVFKPDDWNDRVGPSVGALIDFDLDGRNARRIYRQPGSHAVAPAAVRTDRNKVVAALLAFFLGVFGVHRFYLGRIGSGVVMLILTCTVVGVLVTSIWAFVDFIRYLVMSDAEFNARYQQRIA